jgi:hypothetical protein
MLETAVVGKTHINEGSKMRLNSGIPCRSVDDFESSSHKHRLL